MNKLLLLFPVMLCVLSSNRPVPISQVELKQIFTQIIKDDSLEGPYYVVDSIDEVDKNEITEGGKVYKISYCDAIKNNTWNRELFGGVKFVSKSVLVVPRYSFSMPYLSEDKQSLLIYYHFYCGNLCAESSLRLYKKNNGKWKYIKYYFRMVS